MPLTALEGNPTEDIKTQAQRNGFVRFVVNGYELATSEETITYVPGTYLTWLLDNCREDLIQGRPIELKTSPISFCNLIRRLSYLRENNIRVRASSSRLRNHDRSSKRRKAMEPGPIISKTKLKADDNQPTVCHVTTPLPTHATDLMSSVGFAVCALLETFAFVSSWPTFFDRIVFLLTCGKTPSGSPLVWPYLFHLFNTKTSQASKMIQVHNQDTNIMDREELENLQNSVNISSGLQHQVKVAIRAKGYKAVFTDMKIDMNNFHHWRIARSSDYGIRLLDNDCTVRCLVVHY